MLHLITYDIENDRLRSKVAKWLEDQGLDRIQYSVFIGLLNEREVDLLQEHFENLVEGHKAYHLLCLPLHADMLRSKYELSDKPLDWEYLNGTKNFLIF